MMAVSDKILDCTGLYCPEPIFRTRMAIDEIEAGQILEVHADDPAAEEDLKRLTQRLGHEVLSIEQNEDLTIIRIRKK